jgi:outer membrane translocation and assembly module TamA
MVLFLDSGRTWKDGDLMHGIQGFNTSVGIGARLNVFLIEQYPLVLRLDYAAHINDFSKKRISLSLGPTF